MNLEYDLYAKVRSKTDPFDKIIDELLMTSNPIFQSIYSRLYVHIDVANSMSHISFQKLRTYEFTI